MAAEDDYETAGGVDKTNPIDRFYIESLVIIVVMAISESFKKAADQYIGTIGPKVAEERQ